MGLFGISEAEARVNQVGKDLFWGRFTAERIAAAPALYREDSREAEVTVKYESPPGLVASARFRWEAVSRLSTFATIRRNLRSRRSLLRSPGHRSIFLPFFATCPLSSTRQGSAYLFRRTI